MAPTVADVAGSYVATTFTTRDNTGITDQLTQGSLFNVVLTADGNTTGRLFVPGGGEGGGDFDADLTGTWTLHSDTVYFAHAADTFVRDMPFLWASDKLRGEATFNGVNVMVVLAKQ